MNEPREHPLAIVSKTLNSPEYQGRFQSVLPDGVKAERFTRVVMTAIQRKPEVLDADRTSLYLSCEQAASRGLMPDGREGALVVFNTKVGDNWVKAAQFMPMPEGIIKEMAKAGYKVYVVSIYQNELPKLEIWNDENGQHFKHQPIHFGDRGERIGAVAVATDGDGHTWVEAMNQDDFKRVMAVSKSKDRKTGEPYGPWKDWPERMEQKSALHRLRKRLPIIGHDDIVSRLADDELQDVAPEVPVAQPEPPAAPAAAKEPAKPRRPRGLQAAIAQARAEDAVTASESESEEFPPPVGDEEEMPGDSQRLY